MYIQITKLIISISFTFCKLGATKKKAMLLHERLDDLAFVKFNSRLLEKKNDKTRDPIKLKNVDVLEYENNEWVRTKCC